MELPMYGESTRYSKGSLDKIVTTYFASLTVEPFYYDGRFYYPRKLVVSPLIFRHYTCPEGCGACCTRFGLVWLPDEPRPAYEHVEQYNVSFNGKLYSVFGDTQRDNTGHFCRNLNEENGRCMIHGQHPFSCDIELLRFIQRAENTALMQRLYGRGWAMLRIDGQRGAQCEMIPQNDAQRDDLVRRLERLKQWADYFELRTHIDTIIAWCATGPHTDPLVLGETV